MEVSQLRYFLELSRVGSMSKAAETLNISPQGISIAIRRLEKELGGGTLLSQFQGPDFDRDRGGREKRGGVRDKTSGQDQRTVHDQGQRQN